MSEISLWWLFGLLAVGYFIGLGILGHAVFAALIKDMEKKGKIGHLLCQALLLFQLGVFLAALVCAMGFAIKSAKALEHADTYQNALAGAVLFAGFLSFGALAWLNTKMGKPWHGANER